MSTSVRMTVEWSVVAAQESGPITAALHALMVAARGEPGCVRCHLSTEMGQEAGFRYEEEWRSEEDLKRQLRSPRFASLTQLMERATSRPHIEFTLEDGVHGLEYAEEVCKQRRDWS